ncbi:MAG: beta-propeller domain-containing protein [Oscillospiraceae bacterium]|nr:beta-propeller domain-containing protein [Oscillospiraceae bacterium]
MSDKIKKVLETPEVPDRLKPENITELLDAVPVRKRSRIKTVTAWCTAAAACLVITVGAVKFGSDKMISEQTAIMPAADSKPFGITNGISSGVKDEAAAEAVSEESDSASADKYTLQIPENLAFEQLGSYERVYEFYRKGIRSYGDITGEESVPADDELMINSADAADDESTVSEEEASDISDTYSQAEGISEADVIKANKKGVYYFSTHVYGKTFRYVPFDGRNGRFGEPEETDISSYIPDAESGIREMYLSGDILSVIVYAYSGEDYAYSTAVLTFDVSDGSPEFAGSYIQSGVYISSRMKDNIMYLVTNQHPDYSFRFISDDEDITDEKYMKRVLPFCGESFENSECLDPSCILVPKGWDDRKYFESFVNVSGIDITSPSVPVSVVSVAGNTEEIYCSQENIYLTEINYNSENEYYETGITRFSADSGTVSPQASGRINGRVLNQFSMDEYKGHFRVATTSYVYGDRGSGWPSNNVFVLDMDMNTVGSITGIAEKETIKSVNFQGDTGYVVTYERTDPLFAVNLSDPENPFITDEFKINGFSTFMRKWSDDLLLGFGVDADEDGIETGIKLTMFDVSDDSELNAVTTYSMNAEKSRRSYHSVYSDAVHDRKALLISPERNIIGFPVVEAIRDEDNNPETKSAYILFRFEDGQFKETGQIKAEGMYPFDRAVYIDDYICMFGGDTAVCAEISEMKETDRIYFETNDIYLWD